MTDTPDNTRRNAGTGSQQHSSARRIGLLLLLLLSLVGLLYMRPDIRRPAAHWARQGVHSVLNSTGVSPRRLYLWRLWVAGLYDRPPGRAWRSAATAAQQQATSVNDYITTALLFPTNQIEAQVFSTRLAQGQALQWRLTRDPAGQSPDHAGRLYAALERKDRHGWHNVRVVTADNRPHAYVADADGAYRLLFQPELGAAFNGTLAISRGGSLAFPVIGGHAYDIGGGFGVPRDGGARRHHGIDIFAARGTPVRAVVSGRVHTGNSGIGGQHLWLSSGFAGLVTGSPRYYYAHLDRFAVDSGAKVARGDVIGYVGNTGNARGGPTHLHFGIYTASGAIDPAPFIEPMPSLRDLPRASDGR